MNCCMCNMPIEDGRNAIEYPFCGNYRKVCLNCRKAITDSSAMRREKKLESKNYLANLLRCNQYTPDITVELRKLTGAQVSSAEKEAAREYIKTEKQKAKEKAEEEAKARREKSSAGANGTGFVVAGILFLIAAIALFVLSVLPLDKKPAGIPETATAADIREMVFSAGCLTGSIICFACKGLIKYLRR